MKSHFQKFGNQMSGSGNHLCEFTRAVFYLDHTPLAWTCHAQHAYSCAMKSHFQKFGNQMSGSGNHLCEFTRAVFYLDHTPLAWTCHAQHQYL